MVQPEMKSLFEILSEFPNVAPKNMGELRALAKEYRKLDKDEVADWIDDWIDNNIRHYQEEWEVDNGT